MTERRLVGGLGGTNVALHPDGTVRRETGPWSPTIRAYLQHLEYVGFNAVQRFLGIDEHGREILTYIPGDVMTDPNWRPGDPTPWPEAIRSDDTLAATGVLLRQLHETSGDFTYEPQIWRYCDRPLRDGEIVAHTDLGPHNTVYRDDMPVGFIDWDLAMPDDPLIEFGRNCWLYVPLADNETFARSDWKATPDLPRRLRTFCEAYGETHADRVMWGIQQAKQRETERLRRWELTAEIAATLLEGTAKSLRWLDSVQATLRF